MVVTSCKRTVTTRKRSYSIVGKGDEADDSDKIKKRFASGFSIGEDGSMQTDKKELYSEKSFRKTKNKDAASQIFRGGGKDLGTKEYNTPEYLSRQKDYRTKYSNITMRPESRTWTASPQSLAPTKHSSKKAGPGFLIG